tara:strand:- start:1052 stop:1408 length:357 start_codon:yes stop_codon:yes gene_type:complete
MKKIITIIAALTLTLASCKKEEVLERCTNKTESTLLEIEVNNEFKDSDIEIRIFKNEVPCSQTDFILKAGDEIRIIISNNKTESQYVETLLNLNGNLSHSYGNEIGIKKSIVIDYIFN